MLGRLSRLIRSGVGKLAMNLEEFSTVPDTILVTSKSFASGGRIPDRFTQSGENLFPDLEWKRLPSGTREVVVIVEDPDAPLPKPFVHVIVTNLPPPISGMPEGGIPGDANVREGGLRITLRVGKNTFGRTLYAGPAPLPGSGPHHDYFQVFALDSGLTDQKPPARREILREMEGHVLGKGFLVGVCER